MTTGAHALQIDLRLSDAGGVKKDFGARGRASDMRREHVDLLREESVVEHGDVESVAATLPFGTTSSNSASGSLEQPKVAQAELTWLSSSLTFTVRLRSCINTVNRSRSCISTIVATRPSNAPPLTRTC